MTDRALSSTTGQPSDWTVSRPAAMGLDESVLAPLESHFTQWGDANLHAVVIAKNGHLVYERYFSGDDRSWGTPLGLIDFDAYTLHDIRSITKSVTSVLFGIAHDAGLISHLDAPIFSLLPNYAGLGTDAHQSITVRHLLTMSAGLAWNEDIPYHDERNSERQMANADDPVHYVLSQPIVRTPGAAYQYNGGATTVLAKATRAYEAGAHSMTMQTISCSRHWGSKRCNGYAFVTVGQCPRRGYDCYRGIWRRSASSSSIEDGGLARKSSQRTGSKRLLPHR